METTDATAREASLRKRIRWQQFANTLAIAAFAAGVLAVAGYMFMRLQPRHHEARARKLPPTVVAAPAPPVSIARPAAPAVTVAPVPVIAPAPAKPKPAPPPPPPAAEKLFVLGPESSTQSRREASTPRPRSTPELRAPPREPSVAAAVAAATASAMDHPSGPAAKQKLNSIKCFDQFAYEYQARGRHFFSALCMGGNRMEVSCVGAACKIEYAPPPDHLQ